MSRTCGFLRYAVLAVAVASCLPLPSAVSTPTELWVVLQDSDRTSTWASVGRPAGCTAIVDRWISLDTVSLRPIERLPRLNGPSGDRVQCDASSAGAGSAILPRRIWAVTSFQGSRYHPETIRALGESHDALSRSAGFVARMATAGDATAVVLDFQEMSGDDLPTLMDVARAIADSVRGVSNDSLAMIVPATDSTGYPGRTLGRVADILLVKVFPEHGVGNPPGPIVSPPWFARQLGARAGEVGVNRIVAGLPTDGVLWSARAGARRISYANAVKLAESGGVPLSRDPASDNLHAVSIRDGWELWVSDAELIVKLIADGRRIGVTRFALFGLDGADPVLWQALSQRVR